MANEFIIQDGTELSKLKNALSGEFLFQDSNTMATVYQLADGRVIAYPAVGPKGIIADSEEAMIEILKNGFPIEEENPNPFQKDQARIRDVEKNIDQYLDEVGGKLKIRIDLTDSSKEYYQEINKAVKVFGLKKLYDELFVPFGIFVGEKIRKEKGGRWKLKLNYSYNPYYEPVLTGNDNSVYNPWHKLVKIIFGRKKFDFEYYYSIASIGF